MKKLFTLVAIIALVTMTTAFAPGAAHISGSQVSKTTYVYVCTGSYARVYHSSQSCRGLNNCKGDIIKVSLSDAINKYNKRACKICE